VIAAEPTTNAALGPVSSDGSKRRSDSWYSHVVAATPITVASSAAQKERKNFQNRRPIALTP
jgi:hypothetical protein